MIKYTTPISIQVGTGTAPLAVSSPVLVTNLNADKWEGLDLPSMTGNVGKVLSVNTGETTLVWATAGSPTNLTLTTLTLGKFSLNYNSGSNKLEIIYTP
jgi:hypothetical protein